MVDTIKKANDDGCVAALDLGTNSNRLLIVNAKGEPIFRDVRHVALGEGLAENKCFCETWKRGIMGISGNSVQQFSRITKIALTQN